MISKLHGFDFVLNKHERINKQQHVFFSSETITHMNVCQSMVYNDALHDLHEIHH